MRARRADPATRPGTQPQHGSIAWEREQLARCTGWRAYLFAGGINRHTGQPRDTYEQARADADELYRQHSTQGRPAVVYGITPEGLTIMVVTWGPGQNWPL